MTGVEGLPGLSGRSELPGLELAGGRCAALGRGDVFVSPKATLALIVLAPMAKQPTTAVMTTRFFRNGLNKMDLLRQGNTLSRVSNELRLAMQVH